MGLEEFSKRKTTRTPSRPEPAAFRFVAQWLNQLRQRVPQFKYLAWIILIITLPQNVLGHVRTSQMKFAKYLSERNIFRMKHEHLVTIAAYHFCQLHKKVLSSILLSRLTPYTDEINGDHQYGFRRDGSTTDHIFCISQILEKNCE